ncbi:hypothetical protein RM844_26330 [Streptomyces sp. DSM 44915]|uniref:Apea-like HEPN domain-containing protein n=1 Tax=Streptomyces chisholmiae TaxID=3075540 RepID=A0ABU2JXY0_9ACTN|nr:hypothetical protein [Streptomyces sp. DSM 44915]MDT0269807.1 hypothetical protein [Streptomyces sp. DSM 44915]
MPRVAIERGIVDALINEVLEELGDFVLLPPAEPGLLETTAAPVPVAAWSGLAPLLDYDDGLSGFGLPTGGGVADFKGPTPALPAGARTALLERLAKELPPTAGASPTGWRAGDAVGSTLGRLIDGAEGRPETRPIVIRAWYEPDPTAPIELLQRLVAMIKEAGLTPDRRPRGLVIACPEDLPPDLPDRMAREDIAAHWWWGVLGHLDTATVVATARPPVESTADQHLLLETVTQATVTEVCGPFLDVAAELATVWDGVPETLPDSLSRVVRSPPSTESTVLEGRRGLGRRPHETLIPEWNTGLVDGWAGRVRQHPALELCSSHVLLTRTWLAQNHALLPLLDNAREAFTSLVRERARVPLTVLTERYGPRAKAPGESRTDTLASMEIGALWGAHLHGDIALRRTERERLHTLWTARNRLAHRTPLSGSDLRRLAAVLSG